MGIAHAHVAHRSIALDGGQDGNGRRAVEGGMKMAAWAVGVATNRAMEDRRQATIPRWR